MAIFPGSAITPAGGAGYTIDQSLRFNDDDSAYLSRTPASAGNRKTWTWSGWVKRGNINTSGNQTLFSASGGSAEDMIRFIGSSGGSDHNKIGFYIYDGSYIAGNFTTSQVFRDTSAWYHIVWVWDTTNATSTDRIRLYVNGERITAFDASSYPSLNADCGGINNSYQHEIGRQTNSTTRLLDGYLAEVHFIDGQALDPSYFGETDADYGHWKLIAYTGSYGTNGFYLDFSNSGSIGEDQAGSNDFTANNLAATDVVLDSPTNNFATWNPLVKGTQTFSEGNLKCVLGDDFATPWRFGTQAMTTGKWYMEFILVSGYSSIGVAEESTNTNAAYGIAGTAVARYNGDVYLNGTNSAGYLSSFGSTDVLQVAFDADTRKIWFGRNGTFVGDPAAGTSERGTLTSTASNVFLPALGGANSDTSIANFGQDSSFAGNKTAQNNTDANGYGDFYYSPPSGFLALCTANLSDPAVVPGENFNTVLYAGNGSTNAITGVGFQPDFVWLKDRGGVENHCVFDYVRNSATGTTARLETNYTGGESTGSVYAGVSSFDSDGFTLGSNVVTNRSGNNFVSWNWKADNTSGSSNTDGSITSTVAANPDAGFSIVSWTGTGSAGTVGHGLSQTPDMIIVKNRSAVTAWPVWNSNLGSTSHMFLNTTAAEETTYPTEYWNNTAPTSSVFSVGTWQVINGSSDNMIAYCFHSVDGFSKFGSYTGNGSTDGPFVYCGFRPAFVMFKSSSSAYYWIVRDALRDNYNATEKELFPNDSLAETVVPRATDFLSNGFKLRHTEATENQSGQTYIFAAFAEFPFSVGGGIAR